jgi:hypothetical protein
VRPEWLTRPKRRHGRRSHLQKNERDRILSLHTNSCTARTAPANDNEKVDDWAESDLAWELADAISPLLADRDPDQLYATIGSGESYTAINTVLQTMAHQSSLIPPELITKLTNWLDAYTHSDDAPRLHELLHAIKSLR